MFRKYPKTFRAKSQRINVKGKLNLCSSEQRDLLNGTIEITEKMDGANVAIIRGKGDKWTLQKRRGLAEQGVHAQFSFFWNWARWNEEKILKIPNNWIVYGELMRIKHNIYYDRLPSFFLVFDIWNGKEYLKHTDRFHCTDRFELNNVPIIHLGNEKVDLDEFMNIKSACSSTETAEGIVIKNYRKQMRGKLVRPEFMKELDEDDHWMHKAGTPNKLAEGIEWYA